eukprot:gene35348-42834_t
MKISNVRVDVALNHIPKYFCAYRKRNEDEGEGAMMHMLACLLR